MNSIELKSLDNEILNTIEFTEILLTQEIQESKNKLKNLKNINLKTLSEHLKTHLELGGTINKLELFQKIKNIIAD